MIYEEYEMICNNIIGKVPDIDWNFNFEGVWGYASSEEKAKEIYDIFKNEYIIDIGYGEADDDYLILITGVKKKRG